MTRHDFQIVFLQNACLARYMKLKKLDNVEASTLFDEYNIFKYIRECYDYLHLSGEEYIVKDIAKRIKKDIRYD